MSTRAKALVGGIDTVIMGAFAYSETGGSLAVGPAELVLWGAVVAAAICALIVYLNASAVVAWAAIGYVLFGALLTDGSPHWPLAALALALMPLVPSPRGSIGLGLLVATVAALVARTVVGLLV
jgi:hypothetical protein